MTPSQPELLAPAGDWDCLKAAVRAGADAVYFGLPAFNARLRAENFTEQDLAEVMDYLHGRGRRGYLTMNVLIFPSELAEAERLLRLASSAKVDALIVQDFGLVRLAKAVCPDLELHASTQMTLTSPEGVAFARRQGLHLAVLARELSLRELAKFPPATDPSGLPLEVFVHGALCVAYSGQCLTSEVLGRRSANRGECAQACRLPYSLEVDGRPKDLGDRSYLLSPQDLAAVDEIPELIRLGLRSFKIEGRLKSPDYITAVTSVYRSAIDRALAEQPAPASPEDRYRLEMTFSRGLFPGWLHGVDHQQLVHARFGKKRGPLAGRIARTGPDWVELEENLVALSAGDGVVIDRGADTDNEPGGFLFGVEGNRLLFRRGSLPANTVRPGDRVWKTKDPRLERQLRAERSKESRTQTSPLHLAVSGRPGHPLQIHATAGPQETHLSSSTPLAKARNHPLTPKTLREQLGRLGGTAFHLGDLSVNLPEPVILPLSELNRLRRDLVSRLTLPSPSSCLAGKAGASEESILPRILAPIAARAPFPNSAESGDPAAGVKISVLCRDPAQAEALLSEKPDLLYLDFEDLRRFGPTVETIRTQSQCPVYLATPRIQKAGETGFFRLIENSKPDGVLIRNLGGLDYFRSGRLAMAGDFSLNIANPLSAQLFKGEGLQWLTPSYDLDIGQILQLLRIAPPAWFEITLHQHIPMFHMEHCVFAAFLSQGKDHLTCGRPCDRHRISVRDRVGEAHPVRADVGCRNTVFNARPQSGVSHLPDLLATGLRRFRLELLNESPEEAARLFRAYRETLEGRSDPRRLAKILGARDQLGVLSSG
ncbi:MAG: U32 family peptidase [Verrucomicrobia bacterium]|nr:U32 family peptidase [Verrucomicrobiota bacterium]